MSNIIGIHTNDIGEVVITVGTPSGADYGVELTPLLAVRVATKILEAVNEADRINDAKRQKETQR